MAKISSMTPKRLDTQDDRDAFLKIISETTIRSSQMSRELIAMRVLGVDKQEKIGPSGSIKTSKDFADKYTQALGLWMITIAEIEKVVGRLSSDVLIALGGNPEWTTEQMCAHIAGDSAIKDEDILEYLQLQIGYLNTSKDDIEKHLTPEGKAALNAHPIGSAHGGREARTVTVQSMNFNNIPYIGVTIRSDMGLADHIMTIDAIFEELVETPGVFRVYIGDMFGNNYGRLIDTDPCKGFIRKESRCPVSADEAKFVLIANIILNGLPYSLTSRSDDSLIDGLADLYFQIGKLYDNPRTKVLIVTDRSAPGHPPDPARQWVVKKPKASA